MKFRDGGPPPIPPAAPPPPLGGSRLAVPAAAVGAAPQTAAAGAAAAMTHHQHHQIHPHHPPPSPPPQPFSMATPSSSSSTAVPTSISSDHDIRPSALPIQLPRTSGGSLNSRPLSSASGSRTERDAAMEQGERGGYLSKHSSKANMPAAGNAAGDEDEDMDIDDESPKEVVFPDVAEKANDLSNFPINNTLPTAAAGGILAGYSRNQIPLATLKSQWQRTSSDSGHRNGGSTNSLHSVKLTVETKSRDSARNGYGELIDFDPFLLVPHEVLQHYII
ncbi:hypothetical protein HDU67_000859 [Dinochytrium kinnereticum]|nr:hypothetical protein HDU67_000859 [Dinochytrium kinnereticum]